MPVAGVAVDRGYAGVFDVGGVDVVGRRVDRDADGAEAGGGGGGGLVAAARVVGVADGAVDDRDGAGAFAVEDVGGVDRVGGRRRRRSRTGWRRRTPDRIRPRSSLAGWRTRPCRRRRRWGRRSRTRCGRGMGRRACRWWRRSCWSTGLTATDSVEPLARAVGCRSRRSRASGRNLRLVVALQVLPLNTEIRSGPPSLVSVAT